MSEFYNFYFRKKIYVTESVSDAEEKRKKTHKQKSTQAQVKHDAEFIIEDGGSDTDTDTSHIEIRYIEDGDGSDSDSDLSQSESTITVNSRARLALNEFNAVSTKKAQAIDLNKHLESSEFGLDVPSKVRKNLRRNLENEEVTSPAPPAKKKKTGKFILTIRNSNQLLIIDSQCRFNRKKQHQDQNQRC